MMNRFLTTSKTLPRVVGASFATSVSAQPSIAAHFGDSYFRPFNPPVPTPSAEAIQFKPPRLYREPSFAEYVGGADGAAPAGYGEFLMSGGAAAEYDTVSTTVSASKMVTTKTKRTSESHAQDQVMSICDSLNPFPSYGGTLVPKLQRRASYAGELDDGAVAPDADALARVNAALGKMAGATAVPKLRRRASFAGELHDAEQAFQRLDCIVGGDTTKKAVGPTLSWQPWRQQPMKPAKKRTGAAIASFSSTARIKNGDTVITTVTTTTVSSCEDPFDDGDGFGWGTPRCPVP